MVAFEQTRDGVSLSITDGRGGAETLGCDYLVACDGASSPTRRALGIAMRGDTYQQRWLIVDICGTKEEYHHTRVFCDPARPGITLPGPNGTRRFEFMVHANEDDEAIRSEESVRNLIAAVGPDREAPIRRRVVYTFHARIAERWRSGRVFLAGDAAHLSPPFAGQGMNSGVRDSHNLSWKLAAVLRGVLGDGVLDSYEQERAPCRATHRDGGENGARNDAAIAIQDARHTIAIRRQLIGAADQTLFHRDALQAAPTLSRRILCRGEEGAARNDWSRRDVSPAAAPELRRS